LDAAAKSRAIDAAKARFDLDYQAFRQEQALRDRVWASRGDLTALSPGDAKRVQDAGGWNAFVISLRSMLPVGHMQRHRSTELEI
jgi:hypothetical protein